MLAENSIFQDKLHISHYKSPINESVEDETEFSLKYRLKLGSNTMHDMPIKLLKNENDPNILKCQILRIPLIFQKESFSKAIEPFGDCLEKFKAKNFKQKPNFDVQSSFFAPYDYSTATLNFSNEQKAKEFLIFAKNHIIDTSELVLLEKSHFVWNLAKSYQENLEFNIDSKLKRLKKHLNNELGEKDEIDSNSKPWKQGDKENNTQDEIDSDSSQEWINYVPKRKFNAKLHPKTTKKSTKAKIALKNDNLYVSVNKAAKLENIQKLRQKFMEGKKNIASKMEPREFKPF